ncbi:hypothetical protein CPS_1825 [Colwellia psychrerythraea 34H]|uniref:Uncharacterized protein n=1 Tax=Colwellia psychrerythraea (strain 34H / ATCC BAA-681) TaxID=167879 RepID=Q484G0_COLP3|nr:hypothetical protein CPS_1825 [Colwellia psychrerythraea 34H]
MRMYWCYLLLYWQITSFNFQSLSQTNTAKEFGD